MKGVGMFRIVAVVFISLVGAVVIGRMAQQTIQNSTSQVSFAAAAFSMVAAPSNSSSTTNTATIQTTQHADNNNRDRTNDTNGSILQQQQIHLSHPIQDKGFASTASTTNATTLLKTTAASSTSKCKVAGSTLPAQFTNYSHHIVPHLEQLFDLEHPPVIRHTATSFPASADNSSPQQLQLQQPIQNRPYVTCSIRHVGNWDHFAHTAQQLYRCWSLWQAYSSTHQPVLIATPPPPQHPNAFLDGLYATLVQMGIDWRRDWNDVTPSDALVSIHDTSISASSKVERSYGNSASGSDMFKGYKMLSCQHAVAFRTKVLATLGMNDEEDDDDDDDKKYCHSSDLHHPDPPPDNDNTWTSDNGPPSSSPPFLLRIGILNRQSTRRILNIDEMVDALSARYTNNTIISVFELENQSFADQVQLFRHVQILIAPHGAGLVNTIFLPPCAGVLELNPKGVDHPKFFGSLAALSSHHAHMTLYLGDGSKSNDSNNSNNGTHTRDDDDDWESKRREVAKWSATASRRAAARKRNLCPNMTLVMDAVSKLEQQWRTCYCRLKYETQAVVKDQQQ